MRVAFLSFSFGEYCVRLASALAREADVLLMLPEKEVQMYLSLVDSAVTLRPFVSPRLRQPLRQMEMCSGLCRQIRDFYPDVIHLQHGHPWFNLMLPFLPRCAFVITIHDRRPHPGDKPAAKTPQCILEFGYHRADEIIVHAHQVKDLILRNSHISRERLHVIPHIKIGERETVRKHTPDNHHGRIVLFFGRIWQYKGLEYLIRAEPLITSRVPDAKIVIAGQGEDFSRYRRMMVHPERFIVYNDYISDDHRAELFQQASVVTLPYIEASQSGVIPIAYTFAKPVVATTVGGLPEMVENGRTGLCVPARDEKALADAIVRLLTDRPLADELGANGNRKVNSECSPNMVARSTLLVYHRALDNRGEIHNGRGTKSDTVTCKG
jgi:glycosyltransferase involved in cell wall biosynthesis